MFRRSRRESIQEEVESNEDIGAPAPSDSIAESDDELTDSPTSSISSTPSEEVIPSRRSVIARPRLFTVQPLLLLFIVVIGLAGTLMLLANLGLLPTIIAQGFPIAILVVGVLWVLGSIVGRNPRGILTGGAIVGIGISFLLQTLGGQPIGSTLVGVMMICVGTGILLRGLLLGAQPIA